ncbi:putative efflux protein, MATE family [Acetitomaculum ruminis DSM 5522]|uniref:Multidrug export protein MepA n=1 Tax=Acetitomaculum ruminis DSM 5522 TaxID=1120918 RepID=A0A1I0V0F7_9FIRM|nr:MATE family efflux transporter [Acetitomaculum ruminis]SFA69517.1 putative efflux protein, MATE family [Acetitomaculum ruminis DSM 5522]
MQKEVVSTENNILGTEKIGKLLLKFSIPSIISMLVNSIYNLVDQIFIGQGVGHLGNAATNVAFPFIIFLLAVSLWISAGSAANMSLYLGKDKRERAEKVIGNGLTMAIIAGFTLLILAELFNKPLLMVFGSTEDVLPLAISYSRIYILGFPLTTMGIMLSDMIRADGSPGVSMLAMLAGCITNIILDPIFIFGMNLGVGGAALASIIGQGVTFIVCLFYLRRTKTVKFKVANMKLELSIIKEILSLGVSAFINQLTVLAVQIILNNTATHYGALSKFGADIPLACFGIVMKVNQIMMSIVLGLCTATQPLFGFNYGAKKLLRVKSIFKTTAVVGTTIGIIGTIVIQAFPMQIVSIFGQENDLYNEFAVTCFRYMTILISLMAVQILTSTYFQAVGKPKNAIWLSLSRQFLFLIPCLLIIPRFLGLTGIMISYPISDALSFTMNTIFITMELKLLNRTIKSGDFVK